MKIMVTQWKSHIALELWFNGIIFETRETGMDKNDGPMLQS